jgi:hypothetical protein
MRPTALAIASVAAAIAFPGLALSRTPQAPDRWGPYSVEIVDESGAPLPTFQHRGRTYVLGELGLRYPCASATDPPVGPRSSFWWTAATSDGRPSAFDRRGYVIAPHGEAVIDGYRLDERSVAAFRFSSVPRSYASRMGDARDVGVIGVAVFPERQRPALVRPPWLAERGGVPYDRDRAPAPAPSEHEQGTRAEAPGAKSARPALEGRAPGMAPRDDRPGLGTEFGEEHGSHVERVAFERASSRPAAVLTVRYDDPKGLAAGVDVDGRRWRTTTPGCAAAPSRSGAIRTRSASPRLGGALRIGFEEEVTSSACIRLTRRARARSTTVGDRQDDGGRSGGLAAVVFQVVAFAGDRRGPHRPTLPHVAVGRLTRRWGVFPPQPGWVWAKHIEGRQLRLAPRLLAGARAPSGSFANGANRRHVDRAVYS